MAISMQRAAKLCTAAELNLVKASAPRAIRGLTQKQVDAKRDRARRLRDKHRDLVQRQSLRTRARTGSKHGNIGPKNERTAQKLEIFEEVLERFETRLAALNEAEEPAAKPASKKAPAAKKRPAKRAAKKAASRVKKTRAKAAAKTQRKVSIGARGSAGTTPNSTSKRQRRSQDGKVLEQKIHAHVSSRVRRTQARRDSR